MIKMKRLNRQMRIQYRKFRTRFYEHVDKICKFDIYNSNSEVSFHFNSVFHNLNTYLKYLYLNLKLNLLNEKIANQKYMKKLSFLNYL